jgi:hypothetical protein
LEVSHGAVQRIDIHGTEPRAKARRIHWNRLVVQIYKEFAGTGHKYLVRSHLFLKHLSQITRSFHSVPSNSLIKSIRASKNTDEVPGKMTGRKSGGASRVSFGTPPVAAAEASDRVWEETMVFYHIEPSQNSIKARVAFESRQKKTTGNAKKTETASTNLIVGSSSIVLPPCPPNPNAAAAADPPAPLGFMSLPLSIVEVSWFYLENPKAIDCCLIARRNFRSVTVDIDLWKVRAGTRKHFQLCLVSAFGIERMFSGGRNLSTLRMSMVYERRSIITIP